MSLLENESTGRFAPVFTKTKLRFRKREEVVRELHRTEDEWRTRLTPQQFRVLRQGGTDRPFSVPDVRPGGSGAYHCAGCGTALFPADTKFESGTGWPSFSDAVGDNVERRRDFSAGLPRTEVRCRPCGGHLGHVFGDGPAPSGQRYCINASALASDGA